MSRAGLVTLVALLAACLPGEERGSDPLQPNAPALAQAGADEACLTDPSACPPREWAEDPAQLDPDFPQKNSDCDLAMFPFPGTVTWNEHPSAACQQRRWGRSGIYRLQGRDLHVSALAACGGKPGDISPIRLCSLAWKQKMTPFGPAGPAGCVGYRINPTCHG